MNAYNTLKVIHILSIATWLGVDLGVFLCSSLGRNRSFSRETRSEFLGLLGKLDLGPRVSLIATLPLGLTLAHLNWGLAASFGAPIGWLIALLCSAWAALVVRQHHGLGRWAKPFATFDAAVRVAIAAACIGLALISFAGSSGGPIEASWIRWKVLLFGLMIVCGLWIRLGMRNAGQLFGATLVEEPTDDAYNELDRLIRSLYPPVFLIWAAIVVCVVLATTKPM